MDILTAVILGAVQGLTEFIPVSSSGHLIIVREIFGINGGYSLAYDAVLHLATSLAILIYFWKDIRELLNTAYVWTLGREIEKEKRNLLVALILGTIPVVAIAFLFQEFITDEIRSPIVVAVALIAGSIVFWIAEQVAEQNRALTPRRGLLAGIFQIFALLPGMSRSGITIAGGLFMGLNRETATRFSFLLAFPLIFGAGLKKLYDLGVDGLLLDLGPSLIIGSVTAFIFGLIAIKGMLKYLKNHTLTVFVVYRIILAIIILVVVL
jgi:undecaprenyl-diphosphatase